MFSLCMAFAVFVLGFFALLFNVSRLVAVVDDEGWLVDIQMGRGRAVIQVCLSTNLQGAVACRHDAVHG